MSSQEIHSMPEKGNNDSIKVAELINFANRAWADIDKDFDNAIDKSDIRHYIENKNPSPQEKKMLEFIAYNDETIGTLDGHYDRNQAGEKISKDDIFNMSLLAKNTPEMQEKQFQYLRQEGEVVRIKSALTFGAIGGIAGTMTGNFGLAAAGLLLGGALGYVGTTHDSGRTYKQRLPKLNEMKAKLQF